MRIHTNRGGEGQESTQSEKLPTTDDAGHSRRRASEEDLGKRERDIRPIINLWRTPEFAGGARRPRD